MLVVTASPARTALKISQLTDGGMPPTYDSMHWSSKAAPQTIVNLNDGTRHQIVTKPAFTPAGGLI
jgi:hypothetical protein